MTDGEARDIVNGAALVVAAIYFYRKLIEPATAQGAAARAGGSGAAAAGESSEPPQAITTTFKGPLGSRILPASPGEPATIGGAAAQLLGQGKIPSTERFVVGWGFVFLVLSLSVDASPELAAGFAGLVAVGSVLGNGVSVSKDLHTQLSKAPEATADTADTSPTTSISFAGGAAQMASGTAGALMPEGPTTNRRAKTGKKRVFKVESA